jgi:putative ABC transport system substrate-binding protein
MRRREFIAGLGGAAAWPLASHAQQPPLPAIGFVSARSPDDSTLYGATFRRGLSEAGYLEGRNVTVEYRWLEGRYDRLPALMVDLVRRRVAVIVTADGAIALTSKAATRSQSCSPSMKIQSSLALWPATPGRVATLPAATEPTSQTLRLWGATV